MKLKCCNCGNKFEGTISYDELGWHSYCKECDTSFDVDVPNGKILMLFASEDTEFDNGFEDDYLKNAICSYRAYNSIRAFINGWRKVVEEPEGMWYWVIDGTNGNYITSGACDPDDIEIFKDYFGRIS